MNKFQNTTIGKIVLTENCHPDSETFPAGLFKTQSGDIIYFKSAADLAANCPTWCKAMNMHIVSPDIYPPSALKFADWVMDADNEIWQYTDTTKQMQLRKVFASTDADLCKMVKDGKSQILGIPLSLLESYTGEFDLVLLQLKEITRETDNYPFDVILADGVRVASIHKGDKEYDHLRGLRVNDKNEVIAIDLLTKTELHLAYDLVLVEKEENYIQEDDLFIDDRKQLQIATCHFGHIKKWKAVEMFAVNPAYPTEFAMHEYIIGKCNNIDSMPYQLLRITDIMPISKSICSKGVWTDGSEMKIIGTSTPMLDFEGNQRFPTIPVDWIKNFLIPLLDKTHVKAFTNRPLAQIMVSPKFITQLDSSNSFKTVPLITEGNELALSGYDFVCREETMHVAKEGNDDIKIFSKNEMIDALFELTSHLNKSARIQTTVQATRQYAVNFYDNQFGQSAK